jgi:hypothetical protein
LEGLAFDGDLLMAFAMVVLSRFNSDDGVFPIFCFTGIFDLPFLTFFGGVTIEVDVSGLLEGLAFDGDLLIAFAMVVLILCCVVFF